MNRPCSQAAKSFASRSPPYFQFAHIAALSGLQINFEGGYATIGGAGSLLPGFIVQLRCSDLGDGRAANTAKLLAAADATWIWFDSSDFDAFELLWRLGASATPSSMLFAAYAPVLPARLGSELDIAPVESAKSDTVRVLSEMPADFGGVASDQLANLINGGHVIGGYCRGELAMAAIVFGQGEDWVCVDAIGVSERFRGKGWGPRFMNRLLHHYCAQGNKVTGGIGRGNRFGFRALSYLGFAPVKQAWVGSLSGAALGRLPMCPSPHS